MKIFHIKSIILGIGIGAVLTSLISMIYLAGINPNNRMSKEEIIEQAKQYGMIESTELIKETTSENTGTKQMDAKIGDDNKQQDNEKPSPAPQDTPTPEPVLQEVKLVISLGDSSEIVANKLLNAGLISDKSAFVKELTDSGLATNIETGEFKIKKGSSSKEIMKIITTH